MPIEQEPFRKYNEGESTDTFTIKLNAEERAMFDKLKQVIEQKKDSTAMKQLAWIGSKVLLEEKMSYILGTIFDNKRKNKRLGIIEFEA